jgi:hypothetical protein
VAGCLLVAGLAVPAAFADNPVAPADGGTVVQQCYARGSSHVDDPGYKFCRSAQQLADDAAAACRAPLRSAPDPSAPDYCGLVDGREVSEAKVASYERSWVHRALSLQRGLDQSVPLWEEQFVHTHNSFNASAYHLPAGASFPSYYPTVTNQDPNQVYSMTDQLRMDVRALEIDLHWVPSPFGTVATHGYWVTMCHGDGEDPTGHGVYAHVGCSDDRPLQDGLAEVRAWLQSHRQDVVLIYLENQLYNGGPVASAAQAHDVAARLIRTGLGRYVYQPPEDLQSGQCAPMPYDVSRQQILDSGAQVLLVGNCGPGAWNQWVFTRGPAWNESGNPTTYSSSDCAADRQGMETHSVFRRWYEESPWLEAMTDATQVLTPQTTAQMVRCGANLVGFDQLQPFDGRLAAFVWSWAQDEPSASGGSCAYQGSDSRFRASSCDVSRHFACVDASGDFWVTHQTGAWADGFAACPAEFPGASYAVPPNGWRNVQLASRGGGQTVWLDYARVHGEWTPGAQLAPGPDGNGSDGDGGHGHAYGRHKHHHHTAG